MNRTAAALLVLAAIAAGAAALVLGKKPSTPPHEAICAHLVEVGARAESERPRCLFFFEFVYQTFENSEDPLWVEMSECLLGAEDDRSADDCVRQEIAVLGHVSAFFDEGDGQLFCEHLQSVYCDESLYDCDRWNNFTASSECSRQYAQDLAMTALSMSESRDEFDRRMAAAWACADAEEHQEVGACVNEWLVGS